VTTPPQTEEPRWRARGQQVLVYFGLAEQRGVPPAPKRPRSRWENLWVFAPGLLISSSVWSVDATYGAISLVLFTPTMLLGLVGLVSGVDRSEDASGAGLPALAFAGSVWLTKDGAPFTSVVLVAVVMVAPFATAALVVWFRRRATTRAAGRRTRT
jgi:hypothetical protein